MIQAVAVATATVVPVFLCGGLAVQLSRDLGFPVERIGLAPAAFFGAAALCSPLAGVVTERLGPGRAMRSAVIMVALVLVVAAATVHTFSALLALLAVAGAGNALAQPSTNLFLAQRVARSRQGLAYGVKQSAIPMAGLLSGLVVPLLGVTVGWRWSFVAIAVAGGVVAVVAPNAGPGARTSRTSRREAGDMPRQILVVMAVAAGIASASGSALAVFLVAGSVQAGWSESAGGYLFAAASLVGIMARLSVGFRADRRGHSHIGVIIAMLLAGTVGFALLAPEQHLLFALGAPIAFGFGWGWPGLFILAVVQSSPSSPAAATGLTQTGTSLGAVVGPAGFGLMVERASYVHAWLTAGAGLMLAAATFALLLRYVPSLAQAPDAPYPLPRAGDDRPDTLLPNWLRTGGAMNSRDLVDSYFAACSAGDAEQVADHFAPDAVVFDTNHAPVRGAAEIGRFYAAASVRYGGARWHVDSFVDSGGKSCASEWTMTAPSAEAVVRGSEHYEVADGRITQIRQYWTYDRENMNTELVDFTYAESGRVTHDGPAPR